MRVPLTLTALLMILPNLTAAAGGMDDMQEDPPKDLKDRKVTMSFVRPLVIPPAYQRLRIDPDLKKRPGSPKPPKIIKVQNLWDEKESDPIDIVVPGQKKVPVFFYPKPD